MSTEIKTVDANTDVVQRLASQYGTTREKLYAIVKATCKMEKATNEQFQAFLMIAEKYDLDPITKQMWAFPDKNGGIATMVSVDGWIKIVNNHPQFNGYETSVQFDDKKRPFSATCTIWRKDKERPTTKTLYFSEWSKASSPVWRDMPAHMLEIRAYIQCARMAFNISGIIDPETKYPDAINVDANVSRETSEDEDEINVQHYIDLAAKETTLSGINMLHDMQSTDDGLRRAIYSKAKELGFVFDKDDKCYIEKLAITVAKKAKEVKEPEPESAEIEDFFEA